MEIFLGTEDLPLPHRYAGAYAYALASYGWLEWLGDIYDIPQLVEFSKPENNPNLDAMRDFAHGILNAAPVGAKYHWRQDREVDHNGRLIQPAAWSIFLKTTHGWEVLEDEYEDEDEE